MNKILTNLRTSLGISQRQLAAFIGGDRTQLVRAESGERNLSDNASLQFIQLMPAYAKVSQTALPILPTNGEVIEQVKHHGSICRYKAKQLKSKLQQMQVDYETAHRLKLFSEALQQQTDAAYTPRQQRWVESRIYEAERKLAANNRDEQLLLQLKI